MKEYISLFALAVLVIAINVFHWRYMDSHVVIKGIVFELAGMAKGQDSNTGQEIYFPIYQKVKP